jgi:hypothetical protein
VLPSLRHHPSRRAALARVVVFIDLAQHVLKEKEKEKTKKKENEEKKQKTKQNVTASVMSTAMSSSLLRNRFISPSIQPQLP